MINATISDIAKKYGFDFSRDYANRQAEALAQAERNAYQNSLRQNQSLYEQNLRQIDTGIRNASNALDHEFFQQMLNQQQSQVNTGLNAGIAADQDLRLAMNKQAQLGSVYSQAENARQAELSRYSNEALRLREALDLVEKQRQANAEKMYQELLRQGYDILSNDRSYYNQVAGMEWQRYADMIAQQLQERQLEQQRQLEEARLALQRQQMAAQRAMAQRQAAASTSINSANLSEIEKLIRQYINNPGNYKGGIGSQVGSRNRQRVSM